MRIDSVGTRVIDIISPFSLAATCAPVWWSRGCWPNIDWIDGSFIWVGREDLAVVWRRVKQKSDDQITIEGTGSPGYDSWWVTAILGATEPLPKFEDPKIAELETQFPGLRAFAMGSLFHGLVGSLVGQSISVAAAAVTEQRLAGLFHAGIELFGRRFWPLPTSTQLAGADPALVRQSGVTWRRAHALVAASREEVAGHFPDRRAARNSPDDARRILRGCDLVGPWTAESTLLWGIGEPNAYPSGDAALLRAARGTYERPGLSRNDLDNLALHWHPSRAWACRLLWTSMFGSAPEAGDE